ncbi:MAG TPA: PDZ domain-containing protein [Planktothrix sp.]|jgi:hypothetical protein
MDRHCFELFSQTTVNGRASALKRLAVVVATTALALSSLSALANADTEPQLKSDTPKMDLTVPKSTILKGGVQHQEAGAPAAKPATKPLSGNADTNSAGTGTGKFGFLHPKKDKSHKKPIQARANNDMLPAAVDSGVGIIGVKFVLAFGRPPIINRVFRGTPAYDVGLQKDDVIIAVDGVPTFGLSKEEVYNMIVGVPDTPVTVSISRNGEFIAKSMSRMDFNSLTDPIVRRDYLMSM